MKCSGNDSQFSQVSKQIKNAKPKSVYTIIKTLSHI